MSRKNNNNEDKIHQSIVRIEEFRKSKGIKSRKAFCEQIVFSFPTYSNYVGRGTTPSLELFEAINRRFPELNLHWLITGHGGESIKSVEELQKEVKETKKGFGELKKSAEDNLILSEQLMKKYIAQKEELDKCKAELEELKNQSYNK